MLHKFHNFTSVALLEPFQQARHLNKYRRRLKMPIAVSNCNGKIWLFINHDIDMNVVKDEEQQITVELKK